MEIFVTAIKKCFCSLSIKMNRSKDNYLFYSKSAKFFLLENIIVGHKLISCQDCIPTLLKYRPRYQELHIFLPCLFYGAIKIRKNFKYNSSCLYSPIFEATSPIKYFYSLFGTAKLINLFKIPTIVCYPPLKHLGDGLLHFAAAGTDPTQTQINLKMAIPVPNQSVSK